MKLGSLFIIAVMASPLSSNALKEAGLTQETLTRLETARTLYGKSFTITSGHRTEEKNREVGGVANSYHLKGEAVDILRPRKAEDLARLIWALSQAGFKNVGLYPGHIHADMAEKTAFWKG